VSGAFDHAALEAYVEETITPAVGARIEGDPVKTIELVSKKIGLAEEERKGVLRHLIAGGDLTQYGVHCAVTRTAEEIDSYDRATDLERAGTKVLELPRGDWEVIAKAA
jgi:hypothetical protein